MSHDQAPFFVDNEVIILTKNGIWLADGVEITHEPTRRLFAKTLKKGQDGYFLHVGRETKQITVEDTACFVTRIEGDPLRGFKVFLNDESQEKLDPATLRYRPGRLVCRVKHDQEEAKFLSASYFDLLKHLEEDSGAYFLRICGKRIELARKAP